MILLLVQKSGKLTSWGWYLIPLFYKVFYIFQVVVWDFTSINSISRMCMWCDLYTVDALIWMNIPLRSFISRWGPLLRNLQGFLHSKWSISSNKSMWQDCAIFFMEWNLIYIAITNIWWTTPPHDYKAFLISISKLAEFVFMWLYIIPFRKWLIAHGDRTSPIPGVMGPLPNGRNSWLTNGGDPN